MSSKMFVCLVTITADGKPWAWKMGSGSEEGLKRNASRPYWPPGDFAEAYARAQTKTFLSEASAVAWLRSFGHFEGGGFQP